MKPKNFPERKRQRQISALGRLKSFTAKGAPNYAEISALIDSTMSVLRDIRTKKDRSARGRMQRTA